jgi:hypothetical protein
MDWRFDVTYGIKVSKPGHDVKTCADKDLVLSSGFEATKHVYTSATYSVNLTASGAGRFWGGTYTHNYGYIPVFRGYYDVNDGKWREMQADYAEYVTGLPDVAGTIYTTPTVVSFFLDNYSGGAVTARCKFFLFKNASS